MEHPKLILASASPRRSELLRGLGLPFIVAPTHAEEPDPTPEDLLHPAGYVEKLATLKASACDHEGLIIAADTTVWHDGAILNKPRDEAEAGAMLRRLRGQTHQVFTGVCVRSGDELRVGHETTSVTFSYFSDEFVERYVATGEPMDKAGAYAAQGRGALVVARINGDYWNVVGLPLNRLSGLLREFGIQVEAFWPVP
jgi:septum formation protein